MLKGYVNFLKGLACNARASSVRLRAGAGRPKVSPGPALRDLAVEWLVVKADQQDPRLRPGTEWFLTGGPVNSRHRGSAGSKALPLPFMRSCLI